MDPIPTLDRQQGIKLTPEQLRARAAVKPHFRHRPAYAAWWKACVELGIETRRPSMTLNAVRKRGYARAAKAGGAS
jgi:hypothetical protein